MSVLRRENRWQLTVSKIGGRWWIGRSDDPGPHTSILGGSLPTPDLCLGRAKGRYWWKVGDELYSSPLELDDADAIALANQAQNKVKAEIARARALQAQVEQLDRGGRDPIPDEVKVFVWQRDGGRCVRCGSNQRLEYDHIIPHSMGGSNTERNLQLLCEGCNRSKGGSLV